MAEVTVTVEVDGVRYGGRFHTEYTDSYDIGSQVEETIDMLTKGDDDEGFRPLRDGEEF